MYVCMCVYIYTLIYTHTYVYIYIYKTILSGRKVGGHLGRFELGLELRVAALEVLVFPAHFAAEGGDERAHRRLICACADLLRISDSVEANDEGTP